MRFLRTLITIIIIIIQLLDLSATKTNFKTYSQLAVHNFFGFDREKNFK